MYRYLQIYTSQHPSTSMVFSAYTILHDGLSDHVQDARKRLAFRLFFLLFHRFSRRILRTNPSRMCKLADGLLYSKKFKLLRRIM